MLAEKPGSDDVCCNRCPMSEQSGAFPQQVSSAIHLLLAGYLFLAVLNVSSFQVGFLFHYCTGTMMVQFDPRSCFDHLKSLKMFACPTVFSIVYWQGMQKWSNTVFLIKYALRHFSQCVPLTHYNRIQGHCHKLFSCSISQFVWSLILHAVS